MPAEAMVQPDEISQILKQQLLGFEKDIDVYETGTVLYVGDGIARVHGLSNARATELVEFPHNIMGMALNLEEDNVGCVLFGEDTLIHEGDQVKTDRAHRRGAGGRRIARPRRQSAGSAARRQGRHPDGSDPAG